MARFDKRFVKQLPFDGVQCRRSLWYCQRPQVPLHIVGKPWLG